MSLKIILLSLLSHLPGTNELNVKCLFNMLFPGQTQEDPVREVSIPTPGTTQYATAVWGLCWGKPGPATGRSRWSCCYNWARGKRCRSKYHKPAKLNWHCAWKYSLSWHISMTISGYGAALTISNCFSGIGLGKRWWWWWFRWGIWRLWWRWTVRVGKRESNPDFQRVIYLVPMCSPLTFVYSFSHLWPGASFANMV